MYVNPIRFNSQVFSIPAGRVTRGAYYPETFIIPVAIHLVF